jgi:hypothetical protein
MPAEMALKSKIASLRIWDLKFVWTIVIRRCRIIFKDWRRTASSLKFFKEGKFFAEKGHVAVRSGVPHFKHNVRRLVCGVR